MSDNNKNYKVIVDKKGSIADSALKDYELRTSVAPFKGNVSDIEKKIKSGKSTVSVSRGVNERKKYNYSGGQEEDITNLRDKTEYLLRKKEEKFEKLRQEKENSELDNKQDTSNNINTTNKKKRLTDFL